jgi:hypothetical protein
MIVFQKEYCEEDFMDLEMQVCDMLNDLKDETSYTIPTEQGFLTGKFTVTIEWSENEIRKQI